jgi:hypothetical protein
MIEVFLAIVCQIGGACHAETITLSTEAAAVAMCESGNRETLGSLDWGAVNVNRDGTVALFEYLWDGGNGWRHWAASRDCWDTYVNK